MRPSQNYTAISRCAGSAVDDAGVRLSFSWQGLVILEALKTVSQTPITCVSYALVQVSVVVVSCVAHVVATPLERAAETP